MKLSTFLKTAAVSIALAFPLFDARSQDNRSQSPGSREKRMVLIDPGHEENGKEWSGSGEATAARLLAERLQWFLDRDTGYETFITRNKDGYHPYLSRFVTQEPKLVERAEKKYEESLTRRTRKRNEDKTYRDFLFGRALIANKGWDLELPHPLSINADAIISLHYNETGNRLKQINGMPVEPAHGFCVYVPMPNKATMCLQSDEDHARKRGVESIEFGASVCESLIRAGYETSSLNHERAGLAQEDFVMLSAGEAPSILVECGFIYNPQDRKRACDPKGIDQLAKSLYEGISAFLTPHEFSAK